MEKTVDELMEDLNGEIAFSPRPTGIADSPDANMSLAEMKDHAWITVKPFKYAGQLYEALELIDLQGTEADLRLARAGYIKTADTYANSSDAVDLRKYRRDIVMPLFETYQKCQGEAYKSQNALLILKAQLAAQENDLEGKLSHKAHAEKQLREALEKVVE